MPRLGVGRGVGSGGGLRTAVNPVAKLIADLGGDSVVAGIYLANQSLAPGTLTLTGTEVDAWIDARGSAHASKGPNLTSGSPARPAYNAAQNRIDFDGSNDELQAADGRLAEIGVSSPFALVWVGTLPPGAAQDVIFVAWHTTPGEGNYEMLVFVTGGESELRVNADDGSSGSGANAVAVMPQTGTRVVHAIRRVSGGHLIQGRLGGGTLRTSGALGGTPDAINRLHIGNWSAAAGNWAGSCRMILIFKGEYDTAQQALVNTFAQSHLGATI